MKDFNTIYQTAMKKQASFGGDMRVAKYQMSGGPYKAMGNGMLAGAGIGGLAGAVGGGLVGSHISKDQSPAKRLATILLLGSLGAGAGLVPGGLIGTIAGANYAGYKANKMLKNK